MTGSEQSSERSPRAPIARKLSRPWIVRKLVRDIALSNKTERVLAEEYDCAPSSINEFKQRHASEINAVREDAENEFAGLWIADKQNRIKVYEEQIEHITDRIEEGRLGKLAEDEAALLRLVQSGLKSVAEEMGQLTARVAVQGEVGARVTHEVVGLDPKDLT